MFVKVLAMSYGADPNVVKQAGFELRWNSPPAAR